MIWNILSKIGPAPGLWPATVVADKLLRKMEKIIEGFTQEKNSEGKFVPKKIRAALVKKFTTNVLNKKKELKMPIGSKQKKGIQF